jgi:hypothetical protein
MLPPANGIESALGRLTSKRGIWFSDGPECGLLDAVVVEVVIEEFAEASQRALRVLNQLFIANFRIVIRDFAPITAPLLDHPLPVQRSLFHAPWPTTPWQRIKVAQLAKRQRNVTAIANDVNKERFGNLLLGGRHSQHRIGTVERPPVNSLFSRNFTHHDAQEITAAAAAFQHLCGQLRAVEPRPSEALAAQPYGYDFPAVFEPIQLSKAWNEHLVDGDTPAIDRESPRRQQGVIQQVRSRPGAANHENRTALSFDHRFAEASGGKELERDPCISPCFRMLTLPRQKYRAIPRRRCEPIIQPYNSGFRRAIRKLVRQCHLVEPRAQKGRHRLRGKLFQDQALRKRPHLSTGPCSRIDLSSMLLRTIADGDPDAGAEVVTNLSEIAIPRTTDTRLDVAEVQLVAAVLVDGGKFGRA